MTKQEIRVGGPPVIYGHPEKKISWKEAVTEDRINQQKTAIKPRKNEEIIATNPPLYSKTKMINADELVDMGKLVARLRKQEAEYRKKREAGIIITDEASNEN